MHRTGVPGGFDSKEEGTREPCICAASNRCFDDSSVWHPRGRSKRTEGIPRSSHWISDTYSYSPKPSQSSGPENIGAERPLPGLRAPRPVNSLSRITLENNEKIRPQPDRENAFARASGGGKVTNTELSPVSMASARDRRRNLRINDRQTLGSVA